MTSIRRRTSDRSRARDSRAAIPLLAALLFSACAETGNETAELPAAESGARVAAESSAAPINATPPEMTAACDRSLGLLERCAQLIELQRPEGAKRLREYESDLRLRLSRLLTNSQDEFEHACRELAAQGNSLARQLPECSIKALPVEGR